MGEVLDSGPTLWRVNYFSMLPEEILFQILFWLEPNPYDLYTLATAYEQFKIILSGQYVWRCFIRNRFSCVQSWSDTNFILQYIDSTRFLYHRLVIINDFIDEIFWKVNSCQYMKFYAIIKYDLCSQCTKILTAVVKRMVNSTIIFETYAKVYEFFELLRHKRSTKGVKGVYNSGITLLKTSDVFKFFMGFTGGVSNYEEVLIPLLFNPDTYYRDVDFFFKKKFFQSLLWEIRINARGSVGWGRSDVCHDPTMTREDLTLLLNIIICLEMSYDDRLVVQYLDNYKVHDSSKINISAVQYFSSADEHVDIIDFYK